MWVKCDMLLHVKVATMVRADWLFLLTDVPCLYTANPSTDPSAEPIHEVRDMASLQVCSCGQCEWIPTSFTC